MCEPNHNIRIAIVWVKCVRAAGVDTCPRHTNNDDVTILDSIVCMFTCIVSSYLYIYIWNKNHRYT